jgi:3-dehydroquinate dehydratase-1
VAIGNPLTMLPNHHKSIHLENPNTVAPVADRQTLEHIPSTDLIDACDIVEFRLDSLAQHLSPALAALQNCPLPTIATARHPDEGGENNLSLASRIDLLHAALPYSSVLDIEIRTLAEAQSLVTEAHRHDICILGSFHDFDKTPSETELQKQAQTAIDLGANALKFAARLHSIDDLFRLIRTLETMRPTIPISVMGMGPMGKISRLLAAQCGSFLNYGFLLQSNAPGQWPVAELKRLIATA